MAAIFRPVVDEVNERVNAQRDVVIAEIAVQRQAVAAEIAVQRQALVADVEQKIDLQRGQVNLMIDDKINQVQDRADLLLQDNMHNFLWAQLKAMVFGGAVQLFVNLITERHKNMNAVHLKKMEIRKFNKDGKELPEAVEPSRARSAMDIVGVLCAVAILKGGLSVRDGFSKLIALMKNLRDVQNVAESIVNAFRTLMRVGGLQDGRFAVVADVLDGVNNAVFRPVQVPDGPIRFRAGGVFVPDLNGGNAERKDNQVPQMMQEPEVYPEVGPLPQEGEMKVPNVVAEVIQEGVRLAEVLEAKLDQIAEDEKVAAELQRQWPIGNGAQAPPVQAVPQVPVRNVLHEHIRDLWDRVEGRAGNLAGHVRRLRGEVDKYDLVAIVVLIVLFLIAAVVLWPQKRGQKPEGLSRKARKNAKKKQEKAEALDAEIATLNSQIEKLENTKLVAAGKKPLIKPAEKKEVAEKAGSDFKEGLSAKQRRNLRRKAKRDGKPVPKEAEKAEGQVPEPKGRGRQSKNFAAGEKNRQGGKSSRKEKRANKNKLKGGRGAGKRWVHPSSEVFDKIEDGDDVFLWSRDGQYVTDVGGTTRAEISAAVNDAIAQYPGEYSIQIGPRPIFDAAVPFRHNMGKRKDTLYGNRGRQRAEGRRLCLFKYIRGKCLKPDAECSFVHDATPDEVAALKDWVSTKVCKFGNGCKGKEKCFFVHVAQGENKAPKPVQTPARKEAISAERDALIEKPEAKPKKGLRVSFKDWAKAEDADIADMKKQLAEIKESGRAEKAEGQIPHSLGGEVQLEASLPAHRSVFELYIRTRSGAEVKLLHAFLARNRVLCVDHARVLESHPYVKHGGQEVKLDTTKVVRHVVHKFGPLISFPIPEELKGVPQLRCRVVKNGEKLFLAVAQEGKHLIGAGKHIMVDYHTCPSKNGDCGAPLVAADGNAVGLHRSGWDGEGVLRNGYFEFTQLVLDGLNKDLASLPDFQ
jgi:hypothetical protein